MQMRNDVQVNDDRGLEKEADVMGARAVAAAAGLRRGGAGSSAQEPTSDHGRLLSPATHDSAPIQGFGWLGTALLGGGALLTGAVIHDLYQRYKRYIKPADSTAEHLNAGGVHGQTENPALNVEQGLDTLRQVHDLRNARQDDTRAHLSPVGTALSSNLREGHSNMDEILMRNIVAEFGTGPISEQQFEFAIQKSIMGATRTRGSITGAARIVGGAAETVGLG